MPRSKFLAKNIRCPIPDSIGALCDKDVMEEMRVYERQRIRTIIDHDGIPEVEKYLRHRDSDDMVDEIVGYRCEDAHEWGSIQELLEDLKKTGQMKA